MSKHKKNKLREDIYKVKKVNHLGEILSESIGKGIDEMHAKKAESERKKLIVLSVLSTRKEKFIMASNILELTQTDILNMAIDAAIKKAKL